MALSTVGFTILGNPKAVAKPAKAKRARPSKETAEEAAEEPEKLEPPPRYHHFKVGETVMVAARTFPGSNKQGGVGRVTKVHEQEADVVEAVKAEATAEVEAVLAKAGIKAETKEEAKEVKEEAKEGAPEGGAATAAAHSSAEVAATEGTTEVAAAPEGEIRDGTRWKVVSVDVKYVLGGSERQVSRQYVRLHGAGGDTQGVCDGQDGGRNRSGRARSTPGSGGDGSAKKAKKAQSRVKTPKQHLADAADAAQVASPTIVPAGPGAPTTTTTTTTATTTTTTAVAMPAAPASGSASSINMVAAVHPQDTLPKGTQPKDTQPKDTGAGAASVQPPSEPHLQADDGNGQSKRKADEVAGSKDAPPAKKLSIESFFS
jgi:hypothetical protein